MSKVNVNLIFFLFIIFIILFNTSCFATGINNNTIISSNELETSTSNLPTKYSDLFVFQNNQYDIKNNIDGNVFAAVGTLNIDSTNNGGIIKGNLYATASTVNIKSNVKYSETEKDDFGNYKLESAINVSKINGNVYVTADKFVLEPACEINGDLYILANEIELSQNATINGNVFAIGNSLILNSKIDKGSLYASVKDFKMQYYGFINRDLYLLTKTANLEGYIYRNSFINADDITFNKSFVNNDNLKIYKASNVTFSGEVKGNADIASKNLSFISTDKNGKNINCKIHGNLDYSSKAEANISDKIVSGNINYSEYKEPNKFFPKFGMYLLNLVTSLVYIYAIYLIVSKFAPKYIEKLASIPFSKLLAYFGIGIALLLLIPIVSILLFVTRVGALLGLLLLLMYILMLLIAKPIFIITLSNMIKYKNLNDNKKVNYINILILTLALSLINLIPYVGFIVSLIVMVSGLGIFAKSLKK